MDYQNQNDREPLREEELLPLQGVDEEAEVPVPAAALPPWETYRISADARSRARRGRKTHRGRNALLLILAFLVALCMGGGLMFYAIYSGALNDAEYYIRSLNRDPQAAEPRQDEYAEPPELPAPPPSEGAEEEPDVKDEGPAPEEPPVREFSPVEDAPRLMIVPVVTEGENARKVLDIPTIAELAKPSVVGVVNYQSADAASGYTIGSGIIFSEDGYIITNAHVVAGHYSITVLLHDGSEYAAEVIASDDAAEIAILKIDAHDLTPAEFGDSTQLRVGEISVAIGCPASIDLQGTTTSGIISALDRVITVDASGKTLRLLQTDAAINPGNSGGPLLNQYGQVIGINTIKLSSSTYEGLCFAIPSGELESIVSDLFAYGYVRGYPAIGIMGRSVLEEEDEYGTAPAGVLVASVNAGSGANGKLEEGDIITHCNGKQIRTVAQINIIKNRLRVGDSIILTVYRRGETMDVEIVLVDQYDLEQE